MSSEAQPERRAAAFFDIDGTLVPEPSLERRMFRALRREGAISPLNYARWGVEAVRLLPRGPAAVAQGNKRYLHGLGVEQLLKVMDTVAFFEEGVARVEWHVRHGHEIVLASGMVKPLARMVAMALECELETRGVVKEVLVSATKLEERGGIYTGRIVGDANFGAAKQRAIEVVARVMQLNLQESHAYGNTLEDQSMLEAVGHAHAVNPGRELARVANHRDWQIWHWHQERKLASEDALKDKVKLEMIRTHP